MAYVFTTENFETDVLKSDEPVLVDFWAEWCGPCRAMEPVIEELAEEMKDSIKIGKLNVDQNQSLAETYGVASIPTFLVFKNGQKVDEFMGSMPKTRFQEKLGPYLA